MSWRVLYTRKESACVVLDGAGAVGLCATAHGGRQHLTVLALPVRAAWSHTEGTVISVCHRAAVCVRLSIADAAACTPPILDAQHGLWSTEYCRGAFADNSANERARSCATQLWRQISLPIQQLPVLSYSLAWNMGAITSIMACMHTSRSLKGRVLRQKGHLKSATAAVVEISAPLWTNLSRKLRSSAGPRRRCEQRRVHSGQSRRWQQLVLWSTALLQPYISHRISTLSGHS